MFVKHPRSSEEEKVIIWSVKDIKKITVQYIFHFSHTIYNNTCGQPAETVNTPDWQNGLFQGTRFLIVN